MRYIEKVGHQELVDYILANNFASAQDVSAVNIQTRAELIYLVLTGAATSGKLLLFDFEWSILPIEQIKITCVSARDEKQFTYGF